MIRRIVNYIKLFRIHFFQHIILFALIPLIYIDAQILDYLMIYVLFLILNTYGFLVNDYYDFEMDKKNPRKKTVATLGIMSPPSIRLLNYFLLFLSSLLAFIIRKEYFYLYLLIAFLVWSYSSPPLRFKTRNWLEFPVVILGFGPLNYLYTYFVYGSIDPILATINFFYICAVIGQSQLNNCIKDFSSDKKSGSNNLAQHLGLEGTLYLRKALRISTVILLYALAISTNQLGMLTQAIMLIFGAITFLFVQKDHEDKIESLFTLISTVALILLPVLQKL